MIICNLILTAALAGFVLNAIPVQALEVSKVQFGIKVNKYGKCPRAAIMKIWAHTDGPGPVIFQIVGANGVKTGNLNATAVKGAAGTHLATYTRNITISTNVDTSYMAAELGSHEMSNWVPLKANCSPSPQKASEGNQTKSNQILGKKKVPKKIPTRSGKKKASKKIPKRSGKRGKPVGKPTNGSKPKPTSTCKSKRVSVTRQGAFTKKGGLATASGAWGVLARKRYGAKWQNLLNASDRRQSCKRKGGLLSCTVSARPCKR